MKHVKLAVIADVHNTVSNGVYADTDEWLRNKVRESGTGLPFQILLALEDEIQGR